METNKETIKQLSLGITTEEMKALYFNNAILREPEYKLHQLNTKGGRYYYTFIDDKPVFYPSVTTILRNIMPENRILTEWKLSLGKEASEAYTIERASYGTFIHGQLAELLIARCYDLDSVRARLTDYVEREKLPFGFIDAHEEEAKADIKAFSKWMIDYDVRPYAVEVSLYSSTLGIAGSLDCPCNLRLYSKDDKKHANDDTRLDAIVDFKSGKKGFYDEYALQLELYRQMWNENFPDMQIERIFNIAPKDWLRTVKKIPSYTFEEQTQNPVIAKLPYLLEIYKLSVEEIKNITVISGMINLDEGENDNVRIYTLEELVMSHNQEQAEKESIEEVKGLEELFN